MVYCRLRSISAVDFNRPFIRFAAFAAIAEGIKLNCRLKSINAEIGRYVLPQTAYAYSIALRLSAVTSQTLVIPQL